MRRSDAGFTLLEVIVALAIAAASIASLNQIYVLGWRGMRLAGLDQVAIEVAKNQLASAGVELPLIEGTTSGVSPEGVAWTSDIRPYVQPETTTLAPLAAAPLAYWVSVHVTWREGPSRPERSIDLETLKLATSP